MNSFFEHDKDSIHWHYRCFDHIQLNGLIQPFQQPERVVGLAHTSTSGYLWPKWLAHLIPFFSAREREQAGCQHRLSFSQLEFCDNLIFDRRAALDMLGQSPA